MRPSANCINLGQCIRTIRTGKGATRRIATMSMALMGRIFTNENALVVKVALREFLTDGGRIMRLFTEQGKGNFD